MRVIGGQAGGRRLRAPAGRTTRPMTDRAREGLFSSIAGYIEGAVVIDLHAGSGSLGLEALSRGAKTALFVERDRAALAALRANVDAVGLGGVVMAADVDKVLAGQRGSLDAAPFDIAFVDPPYDQSLPSVEATLTDLAAHMAAGGLVVVHRRDGERTPDVPLLAPVGDRVYGTARLWRFEKEEG